MNSRKCDRKKFIWAAAVLFGIYGILNALAKRGHEAEYIDVGSLNEAHGKRRHCGECRKTEASFYEKYIKRIVDKGLSFAGMVMLAPVYGLIALAIVIDDPGPVLFTQKRVGKNNELFMLHKFRSMKMSTPHDVPTHQLENPEQYITRTGKFLRKYSLDELPQIWDIFRGKMSIIGPRPALWNQDDLVAERDKYGANDILPGLTGWAQINGRDELEIADKARLDGEYVKRLQQGGVKALFFDAKCFFGTFLSVIRSKGVVEGGTGEIHKKYATTGISVNDMYESSIFPVRTAEENIDYKKILIVGAGSYIGNALEEYLRRTGRYNVHEIDAVNLIPDPATFKGYGTVFYVAGIVHQRETEENESLYYKVNRDLAIDTARAAKEAGVTHFILLSSMSVYGIRTGRITRDTKAVPNTHYGRSKMQADEAVWKMRDEKFLVTILRPPMVYGKGCKGNYQQLRKLAIRVPFFPSIKNQRSMIYIGNLCAFIKRILDKGEEGIFFPQNDRYVCTSEMVKCIAALNGKKTVFIKGLNGVINHISIPIMEKVFGNLIYEMTEAVGVYDFKRSMEETEK